MCMDDEINNQTSEAENPDNAETKSENSEEHIPLEPVMLPLDEFLNFNIDVEKINDEVDSIDDSDDG